MQEERIKNLISRAQNILIVPAYPNEPESFNVALALASILNNMGKNANVVRDNTMPLIEGAECKAHIAINACGRDISQIYYEKEKDKLSIFIDYKQGSISLEDISVSNEPKPADFDLVFTVSVENLATLEDFIEDNFKLFYEKPIINISNIASTETFGQINIIEDSPLAQLLISTFSPLYKNYFDTQVMEALQQSAGAYLQKSGNHQKFVSVLEFLSGKIENFNQTPPQDSSPSNQNNAARFIVRALEQMEIDLKSNIPFFFLSENDFVDTGASIKDIALLASHIKQNQRLQFPGFAIVWQKPNNKDTFDALLYLKDQKKAQETWQALGGETRGGAILCSINAPDSNQAKTIITNIL